ncbi:dihydropteroate synthase [Gemella sp. GH3]|uniref:dihydropteroate synthase n=1 Tax=unclassified Gemella TaxID=2624949 RepID=UPI0015CF8800|nr:MULTISPECIES: dihydropteroate synthase [unclassified Gemella]MBF0713349.1 dihydropteroate synthase [Gemella sp. GH3.1]NYS50301.1 dihydropteroate synthase [Gemella sp. GH3]
MNKLQQQLENKKYLIMGILNFTPDSFSDGGDFYNVETAILQIESMIKDGANIIDIGCESTRPGATKITVEEEISRLGRILPEVRRTFPNVLLSIDTYKKKVADFALQNGVDIINDVYGAKNNDMAEIAVKYNAPIIIMHNESVSEGREINDVISSLKESIDICLEKGVPRENIIIDPGIGFNKNVDNNIAITKNLEDLAQLGFTILYAASRKRTVDYILGGSSLPKDRDVVSAALSLEAIRKGASIVRMHNVKIMYEMLATYKTINK